jgi:Tol biopolymer transport system component
MLRHRRTVWGQRILLFALAALAASPAAAAPAQYVVWSRRLHQKDGRSALQVWQTRRDGAEARPLTRDQKDHFWPALSPDGQWLAYLTREEQGQALWVARRDGSKARLLSAPEHSVFGWLTWSPDSRTLIGSRNGDTSPAWEVSTGRALTLPATGCEAEGGLSPSGQWTVSVTGTRNGHLLLTDRQKKTTAKPLEGSFIAPLWRPGQDLLAVSLVAGNPEAQPPQVTLHLLDPATGEDTNVPVPEALRRTWCQTYWSPKGRYLVVITWHDATAGGGEIWLYDLPAKAWVQIGEGRQARVSPDETQVLYVTNLAPEPVFGKQLDCSHLVRYDLAGRRAEQLTTGAETCENPGWGP